MRANGTPITKGQLLVSLAKGDQLPTVSSTQTVAGWATRPGPAAHWGPASAASLGPYGFKSMREISRKSHQDVAKAEIDRCMSGKEGQEYVCLHVSLSKYILCHISYNYEYCLFIKGVARFLPLQTGLFSGSWLRKARDRSQGLKTEMGR